MDVLAKKLSILMALLAMIVIILAGFIAGLPWELVLARSGGAFIVVVMVSIVLFKLALDDKPGDAESGHQRDNRDEDRK